MAFDFKKEYKEFYIPPKKPVIVEIPKMNYIAVRGKGNPNEEISKYQEAVEMLYGIAYTIKMSKKSPYEIEGYFEYVVPPLEGLWWQEGVSGVDFLQKERFQWISMIRLPDFVDKQDFDWAVKEAGNKKKKDFSEAEYFTYDEGICVQCMHIGSYDEETKTIQGMTQIKNSFAASD
ncbi:GyrI-like domain-containing protein [Sinanaerobacter sp. ZZT-01]|nr:GyrI-like domain-containing protein [Sinanaerobacter sp. ZZT-01]WRR94063.1 GyrI-like domain-containing protein [Sinanaerobacter sp. ZZT-01]